MTSKRNFKYTRFLTINYLRSHSIDFTAEKRPDSDERETHEYAAAYQGLDCFNI